jgi:hypothetical protein
MILLTTEVSKKDGEAGEIGYPALGKHNSLFLAAPYLPEKVGKKVEEVKAGGPAILPSCRPWVILPVKVG